MRAVLEFRTVLGSSVVTLHRGPGDCTDRGNGELRSVGQSLPDSVGEFVLGRWVQMTLGPVILYCSVSQILEHSVKNSVKNMHFLPKKLYGHCSVGQYPSVGEWPECPVSGSVGEMHHFH